MQIKPVGTISLPRKGEQGKNGKKNTSRCLARKEDGQKRKRALPRKTPISFDAISSTAIFVLEWHAAACSYDIRRPPGFLLFFRELA